MTNGFGGEPAVEEIAEKLEQLVTCTHDIVANQGRGVRRGSSDSSAVRSSFLSLLALACFCSSRCVQGEILIGHDVELDNRSAVKITEVDQARVDVMIMTNQLQEHFAAMISMDVANGDGKNFCQ